MPVNEVLKSQLVWFFDHDKYIAMSIHLIQLWDTDIEGMAVNLFINIEFLINFVYAAIW